MPTAGTVDTNGLKSRMMLFSGELSMTSSLSPLEPTAPLPPLRELDAALPSAPPGELGEPLEEQAARPAATRPLTVSARVLLLILALVATIDLAFPATVHGEFTAKDINRSAISIIIDVRLASRGSRRPTVGLSTIPFPGMTKACPEMDGQAFVTASGGCRRYYLSAGHATRA